MIVDRLYAALLIAFPRRFRRRYGEPMRQAFRARYADAIRQHRRFRFLARTLIDVLGNAALERVAAIRNWFFFPDAPAQLAWCEQERRPMPWQALKTDVRYALRMFVRTPVFTALIVLALALGIGANSAIFSVVHGVLMKPLPFAEPGRLLMIWSDNTREGVHQYPMSLADFADTRGSVQTLDRMEAMLSFLISSTLQTSEGVDQFSHSDVTPGMFDLLGRQAALGRTFHASDRASEPYLILSDGYWRRRFGADPNVIGRQLSVSDRPMTVIGVMPPDFHFPLKSMLGPSGFAPSPEPDSWILLDVVNNPFSQNGGPPTRVLHALSVIGRLAPGATADQARQELASVAARLAQQYPDSNRFLGSNIVALHDQAVGRVRSALILLLAGVAFVLLIACVNVANLLLARSVA